jgi:hemoglobin-like flavoprotein
MVKKFFEKKNEENINNKNILITALLIHAAKIDDNYTDVEKEIIKKALTTLNAITSNEAEELLFQWKNEILSDPKSPVSEENKTFRYFAHQLIEKEKTYKKHRIYNHQLKKYAFVLFTCWSRRDRWR